MTGTGSPHRHGWLVGSGGIAVGVALLMVFPKLPGIAGVVFLVALFHLFGAIVLLGAAYGIAPASVRRRVARWRERGSTGGQQIDYGWSFGARYGNWIGAVACGAVALGLQLAYPALWPAWFAIALLGLNSFVGGVLMRTSKRQDWATLPLVDLLATDHDRVLDAGCGSGRTTIALGRVLKKGRVVALDRFDASYIAGGGRTLIERNLRLANLSDRVTLQRGDITSLPFGDATFDSAISSNVIDHLGSAKATGLREIQRVLRPGGRFLMVVWVPGWVMFAIANVVCLLLTSKATWRRWAGEAGFTIRDEGVCNGGWFVLLEKPN